jgi:hypothetical protein
MTFMGMIPGTMSMLGDVTASNGLHEADLAIAQSLRPPVDVAAMPTGTPS